MIDYIITPTNQFNHKFLRTIDSVLNQTCDSWIWLIVNDSNKSIYDSRNSEEVIRLITSDSRVEILENGYNSGAGSARNYALDYIRKTVRFCNLFFIDAGDEWIHSFIEDSKNNLAFYKTSIVSGSYLMKWQNGKSKKIVRSGRRTYQNMLEDYSTSCLSTSLQIKDTKIFSKIRFGETKRVNDQPFFLSAVKHFGFVEQIQDIQATYHVGDSASLSGKKLLTAYGKWKVLRNQKLSLLKRYYYFWLYFYNGFKKYYL